MESVRLCLEVCGVCVLSWNKYEYHMNTKENYNRILGDNLLCTSGFVET